MTVPVPGCPVCERPGQIRYAGLRDHVWLAPGEWSYRACDECGVLWLDPRPSPESFGLIYPSHYLTHERPADLLRIGLGIFAGFRREVKLEILRRAYGYRVKSPRPLAVLAGLIAARVPSLRRRVGYTVLFLPARRGLLLDIGCGNGAFLLLMSRLGWDVQGLDPDQSAAVHGQQAGVSIETKSVEEARLPPSSCDAITLHHVLEHLVDPVGMFTKLSQALRPGGLLVSISPNPAGALAQRLGSAWRELDPPRHLALLGPRAVAALARGSGLVPQTWTTARNIKWILHESLALAALERAGTHPERPSRWVAASCRLRAAIGPESGEEVVVVARKP